jgi:hypothetical protein
LDITSESYSTSSRLVTLLMGLWYEESFSKLWLMTFPIKISPLALATRPQASDDCIFATFTSLSWLKRLSVLL